MAQRTVYGWEDPFTGKAELSTKSRSVTNRPVNRYDTRTAAEAEIARRNPSPLSMPTLIVEWEE